jgi:PucR family transcriptional regulator, purine catabolism regulatory protein
MSRPAARFPPFTLGDILDHRPLRLQLLSGDEKARARPVLGAHSIEVENPTRWLAPRWVMLTTGMRLHRHPEAQAELIAELEGAGIAALGFAKDVVFREVPSRLLEEAEARNFPVFSVPWETGFREVVRLVDHCLVNTELRAFHRLSAILHYLSQSLGETEPREVAVQRLTRALDVTVVLFDPAGSVQVVTGKVPTAEIWTAVHGLRGGVPHYLQVGDWHLFATPVDVTESSTPGWLVAASRRKGHLSPLTKPVLQMMAPLLSAIERLASAERHREARVKSGLLDEILGAEMSDQLGAHRDLIAEAEAFGLRFHRSARIVIASTSQNGATRRSVETDGVSREFRRAFIEAGAPHLISVQGHSMIALVETGHTEIAEIADSIAASEPTLRVGIGRAMDSLADARRSFTDAQHALNVLAIDSRRSLAFDDFDLGTLMLSVVPPDWIDAKLKQTLHELRGNAALYEALVAYFENKFDVPAAAKSLFLHPNSMRYRLSRVEQLVGGSLKDPSVVTSLYLALLAEDRTAR